MMSKGRLSNHSSRRKVRGVNEINIRCQVSSFQSFTMCVKHIVIKVFRAS